MANDSSSSVHQDPEAQAVELPDTSRILRLIQRTRRLLKSTWVTTGLGVTVGLCVAALLLVALTDIVVTFSWELTRLVGLLIVAVPTAWVFVVGVLRPLFRSLTSVIVARRIETEIPGIHNRLVSCVDLSGKQKSGFHSMAFHRRLVAEAIERISKFRIRHVLDLVSLRRAGMFSLLSVAAFVVAFGVMPERLSTAMARIFQPFADIPPASGVFYDVFVNDQEKSGDYATLRGEDISFRVIVRRGEVDPPGGDDPLRLVIEIGDEEGAVEKLHYDFSQLKENRTSFTLTGMQSSFHYRVYGGGTWSKRYAIKIIERPRIVGLQTEVSYPAYMKMPEPKMGRLNDPDITAPKESQARILVDVAGDASEGEIELLQRQVTFVEVQDRPERSWALGDAPEGATREGNWQFDEEKFAEKAHFDPATLPGILHQHGFHTAPVGFEVQPGEVLYSYVFIPEDQIPETIMLKWHDGSSWEHRAFWGQDLIAEGQVETASRRHVGDLPEAGKLVRLEVPASAVDMEGRRIHGMMFSLHGGHGLWTTAGAMPPAKRAVNDFVVTESFLLSPEPSEDPVSSEDTVPSEDPVATPPAPRPAEVLTRWSGEFPVTRDGYYRIVLRNELQYPNPGMQEGKITALIDGPPQVILERPGVDLIVSKPIEIPLYVAAYDDYGLQDIVLEIQKNEDGFQGRPVKTYEENKLSDAAVVTLDLSAEEAVIGDTFLYRVEVRDRKGNTATTRDFSIRLAEEPSAEDLQQEQFQDKTEQFQEQLEELVQEQQEIQEAIEATTEEHEALTQQIEQAKAEAAEEAEASEDPEEENPAEENADPAEAPDPDAAAPEEPAPEEADTEVNSEDGMPEAELELDADTLEELNELRAELDELAAQQDQNAQQSEELAAELADLAAEAPNLQTLPREIANELQNVQEAFDDLATQPMKELSEALRENSQPESLDPELPQIEEQADEVQQNLEDLQERFDAIAEATETSQEDVDQSLVDLRSRLTRQDAEITARELTDLQEYMEALREELAQLREDQEGLIDEAAEEMSERLFENVEENQEELDSEADPALAEASDLLEELSENEQLDELAARNEAGEPMGDEETPEEDAGEEDASEEVAGEEAAPSDAMPNRLSPALAETTPEFDERLAEKVEAMRQAQEASDTPSDPEREAFREDQFEQLEDLDVAEQSLRADEETLSELLEELALEEAASAEEAERLAELLNSAELQEAREMFERMNAMNEPQESTEESTDPSEEATELSQLPPASQLLRESEDVQAGVELIMLELDDLDVATRAIIMQMQPKAREELLQGLREEGPEAYRHFIRDYFRRLSKVQASDSKAGQ